MAGQCERVRIARKRGDQPVSLRVEKQAAGIRPVHVAKLAPILPGLVVSVDRTASSRRHPIENAPGIVADSGNRPVDGRHLGGQGDRAGLPLRPGQDKTIRRQGDG